MRTSFPTDKLSYPWFDRDEFKLLLCILGESVLKCIIGHPLYLELLLSLLLGYLISWAKKRQLRVAFHPTLKYGNEGAVIFNNLRVTIIKWIMPNERRAARIMIKPPLYDANV